MMLNVSPDLKHLTVVVTVRLQAADSGMLRDFIEHARLGLKLFPDFDGYIDGALHQSKDALEILQYTQWTDRERFTRAISDASWQEYPSTGLCQQRVAAGLARMTVGFYDVIDAST